MAQGRVTMLGKGLNERLDHRAQTAGHLNTFRTVVPYLGAGKMYEIFPIRRSENQAQLSRRIGDKVIAQVSVAHPL